MKKFFLAATAALLTLISCTKGDDDPRLVIITFDGLRWQELFSGADEGLVGDTRFVKDPEALKAAYWRDTPEARREALMPFVWSHVPQHGYFLGNREKNSLMQVANDKNFSYPGYSEMFCGYPDDERIDSNDPVPNPNHSVLEAVNADPRYKGSVMMLSSWESIRFAVNNERGGFPGSSAHEPLYIETAMSTLLQEIDEHLPGFGGGERADFITAAFALETLKEAHPKVFYVGFGDTDEFSHAGEYDKYLEATHWTDGFIRRIVESCEADPFYKGKTTYILTCDHGRGRGAGFQSHGADVRGSNQTWFIAFGKGVPVLGETKDNGIFYTKQFAATIADILGVDFTPDNGQKCEPFDPAYYKEPEAPKALASFEAVKDAKPKGKGLRYTYAEGDFMSVVPMLNTPVKARGIAPVLSTGMKLREDHFGLVFKGLVKVPEDGLYLLSLASDDGSKLFWDGQLLWDIDRDGGGFREGWYQLTAGYHRIELQYFENYGGENIEIGLTGPGVDVENLPADMLFYE
ncbi:MAG: hypothetical protein J6M23_00905 [Bacteroidales bacterium]|nr:hypothetical protein [Bacteroidales bacterium]MBQ9195517.1 hypothetical protein [Bacteroidales bacterium]